MLRHVRDFRRIVHAENRLADGNLLMAVPRARTYRFLLVFLQETRVCGRVQMGCRTGVNLGSVRTIVDGYRLDYRKHVAAFVCVGLIV